MIKSGIKIGDKFNRWTVVGEPIVINTRRKYLCKCDCGTERYVDYYSLVRGESKPCGTNQIIADGLQKKSKPIIQKEIDLCYVMENIYQQGK